MMTLIFIYHLLSGYYECWLSALGALSILTATREVTVTP